MPKAERPSKSTHSKRLTSSHNHHRPQRLALPSPPQIQVTTDQDIAHLRQLLQTQFRGKDPRLFQVELVKCQQERRDALCQAATGMGKTAVAAGPYAIPENKERITLMVSPLIGLQNEMVRMFFCLVTVLQYLNHSTLL